jgi:hypothetical protein
MRRRLLYRVDLAIDGEDNSSKSMSVRVILTMLAARHQKQQQNRFPRAWTHKYGQQVRT